MPKDSEWTTARGYIVYHLMMSAEESGIAIAIRMDWAKTWSMKITECERHYAGVNIINSEKNFGLKIASIYISPNGSHLVGDALAVLLLQVLRDVHPPGRDVGGSRDGTNCPAR